MNWPGPLYHLNGSLTNFVGTRGNGCQDGFPSGVLVWVEFGRLVVVEVEPTACCPCAVVRPESKRVARLCFGRRRC